MNIYKSVSAITLASVIVFTASSVYANEHSKGIGKPSRAVVYVTSQDLYYDTLLLKSLPYNETVNFQLLEMAGPTGVQTEFGPMDTGYYGGRWWVDANGNGMMDEAGVEEGGDAYFLCPLLGPGRQDP
jgi:hypothetical protein